MGAEFLELDLGFEAVLGFHYHVYQFVVVIVPFFDVADIAGTAFIIDDEGHNVVAQTFLEHKQSAHATVTVLEGEDLIKADMEIQDMILFNFRALFVGFNQFCQAGIDLIRRQQFSISWARGYGSVFAGAYLLAVKSMLSDCRSNSSLLRSPHRAVILTMCNIGSSSSVKYLT